MGFDREGLERLVAAHGRVVRVVVADVAGSAPREAGAAMCVWVDGQEGTVGGGALEWQATATARAMLAGGGAARTDRLPLGPALNQCCGGAVTLLSEVWDRAALAGLAGPVVARPLPGRDATEMPLAVARLVARARAEGQVPGTRLVAGWLVEPIRAHRRDLWVWGAGHVGRAIVPVLAPLPEWHISWADTDESRFPEMLPEGVTQLVAANPADLVGLAPRGADHLVLTFSHALDLELCHRLLGHGFGSLGLIGSATKWARFRSRLSALGHPPERIARIVCPIGEPAFGKHPQAIAIGVAAKLLESMQDRDAMHDPADDRTTGGQRG
ncbi:MAG: xanthine dehydrogenase accessory protein XdhC [Proteobacteria bacterium]|nr:xanthine dehydrogenase accessory protein XdhC [Pseudomonadota bacterium]MBS0572664.1 xanthine dehydrogenase accessory protein XdhC [Pseudomonadota bacterium]